MIMSLGSSFDTSDIREGPTLTLSILYWSVPLDTCISYWFLTVNCLPIDIKGTTPSGKQKPSVLKT